MFSPSSILTVAHDGSKRKLIGRKTQIPEKYFISCKISAHIITNRNYSAILVTLQGSENGRTDTIDIITPPCNTG
jgi:hypothetical protein